MRPESEDYGKVFFFDVPQDREVYIPKGFAHGFLVLSPTAEFLYKTTDYYHPQSEVCLAWDDPSIAIEWPLPNGVAPNVNAKDAAGLPWDAIPKF